MFFFFAWQKKNPRRGRYIIIGDTAVGKSCLLLQFTDCVKTAAVGFVGVFFR